MTHPTKSLRTVPAVEKVLQAVSPHAAALDLPRPVVVAAVRSELAKVRSELVRARKLSDSTRLGFESALNRVRAELDRLARSRIQPVVNGTGVIVHTNLGRAPLGVAAVEALREIGGQYNTLEYDLGSGGRGGRAVYLENALAILCEAEAATVVNNCAAALVLVLRHFAGGNCSGRNEVVISRGELVQIGGGFRIPEILEASGAKLREVGTTNQTSVRDYERAVGKNTALILKVHRSNFFMNGFVASPSTEELAALARKKRLPFVEDLGSGAVVETGKFFSAAGGAAAHEPTPSELLRSGVDLVTFSGDKLLGGPQAGVIAGKAKLVAQLKKDPLFRALRCSKLVFAALEKTVDCYLRGATDEIPILGMLGASNQELMTRAKKLVEALGAAPAQISIGTGRAQVGGGTLPQAVVPSVTLDIVPRAMKPSELAARLRLGSPPVIGYIERERLKLDLRTIFPSQDEAVASALLTALSS